MSHSSENCLGKFFNQHYIKDGLVGPLGNRGDAHKQHRNSGHKQKKELKALRKKDKMIYRITNNSGLRRELKNTKNIKAKISNNI